MSNQKNITNNFPILGVLGLIFITLKLTGHITWPWLCVLSPFWIPIAVALLIVFIVAYLGKN